MTAPCCSVSSIRAPRRVARAGGFPLVDLLVLIGIIPLLISILLPALSKAKESANTVKCLANLRSIGQAAAAYSSDHRGMMVPCAYAGDKEFWYVTLVDEGYVPCP